MGTQATDSWFEGACADNEMHSVIEPFRDAFSGSVLSPECAEDLNGRRRTLGEVIRRTSCERALASAIDTLRRVAFQSGEWDLDLLECCYGHIENIWNEASAGGRAKKVFQADRLLSGWAEDIGWVQPRCLAQYVEILGWTGVSNSGNLQDAVSALEERTARCIDEGGQEDAANAAFVFIKGVMNKWIGENTEAVVEHLRPAFDMAAQVAKAQGGSLEPLENFKHLVYLLNAKLKRRQGKEARDEVFAGVYDALVKLYDAIRSEERKRRTLRGIQEVLVPALKGHKRPHRHKCSSLRATIGTSVEDEKKEWPASVMDISADGCGWHLSLDGTVHCSVVAGSEERIPAAPEAVRSVVLTLSDRNDQSWDFREATLTLHRVARTSGRGVRVAVCRVWALRGWTSRESDSEGGAAVFWLEKPPKGLQKYRGAELQCYEGIAQPSQVLDSARNPTPRESPMVSREGGEKALDVVRGFIEDTAKEIQEQRGWEALWTRGRPIEERAIGAQLRSALRKHVEPVGMHVSSEEESGLGPCDFLVTDGPSRMIIELKLHNGDWQQGIGAQLPSLMVAREARCGVFLLYDFEGSFRPRTDKLATLQRIRDEVCAENLIRIDLAVMNCTKPAPASKRKRAPKTGDHMWYYEGLSASKDSGGGEG